MRVHPAAIVLSIAAATVGNVWAQASTPWKWRDERGQVHVSDLPPPSSVPASAILERPPQPQRWVAPSAAKPAASAPAAGASAPRVDPELEARRKRAADDQLAQQKAAEEKNNAIKAENCSRARQQLQALTDGYRMTRTNAQGEREVLDDKGRAEEMQRARSVIASDCGK
jgi:hypothetical protein